MNTSREVAKSRHLPFRLGLAENDIWALHIVYGLYALSTVTAVPALLGVVLAHLKRPDYGEGDLASHAIWQIRSFWIMAIATLISMILAATFILIPFAWMTAGLTWLWFLYRIIKGWLALSNGRAIANPYSLF